VIGVPDDRMGEEVCACVSLKPNQTMDLDELKQFCKNKISHFKIPRYLEIVNEFPMTVTGKIQKNILKERIIKKLKL
jgi:acyl-CoA synthetase (AMP-forming)/AMP-acid ligase II